MRCPVSDRHSDQTVPKLVGLCGRQGTVKMRGVCSSHPSGPYLEDRLPSMERAGWLVVGASLEAALPRSMSCRDGSLGAPVLPTVVASGPGELLNPWSMARMTEELHCKSYRNLRNL